MNLLEAMERYIDWQRSHGAKFETSAHTLLRFAKGIGEEIDCDAVTPSPILDYLTGNGPLIPPSIRPMSMPKSISR